MSSQEIFNRIGALVEEDEKDECLHAFIANLFILFDGCPPERIRRHLEDLVSLLERASTRPHDLPTCRLRI